MNKPKILAFTIVAKNYYPQAEIVAKSYKKYHPDHEFFVFFIDDDCIQSSNYQAVPITKVNNISDFKELCFKYSIMELATAVKPFIFTWLFNKYSAKKVLYIDPDICFYKKINKILNELDSHDCVVIPHRTSPTNDDKRPNEWDFMACGYYNLGFVAFKNSKSVSTFLSWWATKLKDYAYSDIRNYMFTDQKWMDFAPSFLNTYILRDKGYDTAYWNLHEYIGIVPPSNIYFFHFSGFVPEKSILSKHQNRFTLDNIGSYKQLFQDYAKKIFHLSNLHSEIKNYRFPYQCFNNGVEITSQIKNIYRHTVSIGNIKFSSLFDTESKNSFFYYISKVILISKNTKVLNYFLLLNESNREIHKEFPLDQPYNLQILNTYINWSLSNSKSMYDTPEYFIKNQRKLSKGFTKTIFKKNISIPTIQTIIALEKDKKNKNNPDFIISSYKIILHRNPDADGYNKNLNALNNHTSSRNLFLFKLFNSAEFYYKHGKIYLNAIFLYYLYLASLSVKYLFLDKYLLKTKNFQPSYKNDEQPKKFSIISNVGCNISGYLDTESGVGESARGMIRAFQSTNIPISVINIDQPWLRRDNKEFFPLFTEKNKYKVNLLCVNADQVENVINNNLKINLFKDKYNIGYWYWESNLFPQQYKNAFEYFDEIWVASEYIKKSLEKVSPIPVFVIPPLFIEPDIKSIKPFNFYKCHINIKNNDYVFLNIFDSASFWERKNPFALIKSFKKSFSNKTGVKLIIKTTEIKKSKIYPKLFNEIKNNKNIVLIDKYLTKTEINQLENRANCYVSLHRSEGLGIPLIESMMLKKPVIATNFGGNTDFMNASSSFPIKCQIEKLKSAIGPYPKNSIWAIPDINQAASVMRFVYEKQGEAQAIAEKGRLRITKLYNSAKIGKLIKSRLLKFLY